MKMALPLVVAALAMTQGAFSEVVHTAADGTTFDVTDGVLTITVPSGQTQADYDYVGNILDKQSVTSVVKDGPGVLTARAASGYGGTWLVRSGVVQVDANVNTAFGAAATQPVEANKVTVASGASVKFNKSTALDNRLVEIAGAGVADSAGALSLVGGNAFLLGTLIRLTADATIDFRSTVYVNGMIDVNGHKLSSGGGQWTNGYYEYGGRKLVVTNSAATAATFEGPSAQNFKFHLTAPAFLGGSENVFVSTGQGRTYMEGLLTGDWSLSLLNGSRVRGGRTTTPPANYGWSGTGPISVTGTATFSNEDNTDPGYGCILKGSSLTGASTPKVVVTRGCWLSLDIPEIDFPGSLDLQGGGDATYRCQVRFQKGTPYLVPADKTTTVKDSDIWMDSETVRQLSPIAISSGACSIVGSAAGTTIPSVTVTGGATNVLDTPAEIATYTLTKGVLKLGTTLPTIKSLSCVTGTTLDLDGQDLAVETLTGSPTVLNGGTIAADAWSLDVASGVTYGSAVPTIPPESTVVVSQAGGNLPLGRTVVAYFPGGTSLPDVSRFVGRVADGNVATFFVDTVRSGPNVGKVEIAVNVGSSTPVADETIDAPDGTVLKTEGQLLTITVPANVTNEYDYSQLVASHYVTNIVKKGEGTLKSCSLPSYAGDITIEAGYFALSVADGLGARNVGVTRVRAGGSLAVTGSFANGAIAYETIEMEGTGPDGRGAVRGPGTSSNMPLQHMNFYLTGDALWLNDRYSFRFWDSTIDVAGHVLSIRARTDYAQTGYFNGCTVTNSVPDSPGKVMTVSCPNDGAMRTKTQLDGSTGSKWVGGSENVMDYDYRVYIGKCDGDWTLPLKGLEVWGGNSASSVAVSNANYWSGPMEVLSDTSIQNNEATRTNQYTKTSQPYPVSVMGPIHGAADKTLTFDTALHLFSNNSDFQGTVKVTGKSINDYRSKMTQYFRNGLWLHDGAVLSCGAEKPVQFDDADLWFADKSALCMPAMKHATGDLWVTGGAKGGSGVPRPTIASIVKTSTDGLYFDSPVVVAGTLSVEKGLLSLGTNGVRRTAAELPVFSNLVFAAGTTFDLDGNALEIPNLTGAPTVANAGTITISGSYTMAADETFATEGSVVFADGATVVVPVGTRKRGVHTVLTAAGGITGLPTVQGPDKYWQVRVEGNSVVAEHVSGTMILLR